MGKIISYLDPFYEVQCDKCNHRLMVTRPITVILQLSSVDCPKCSSVESIELEDISQGIYLTQAEVLVVRRELEFLQSSLDQCLEARNSTQEGDSNEER